MKNKKVIMFIMVIVLILLILYICYITKNGSILCTNQDDKVKKLADVEENYKMVLNSIARELTQVEAAEKGYFVYDAVENKVYNKDVLDRFVKNTQMNATNRISDEIIIVIYNIEGDPTIYNLGYIESIGYILAEDATRVHISKTELKGEIPKQFYEIVINTNIPSEHYGIAIEENFGFSTGIISLISYSEDYKDIEIARYSLKIDMVDTKINPNEVTTIDIYKTSMLKGEEEKTITLNQEETREIIEIINSLDFKEETCDGICKYYINLNSDEKELYKNYGIEVYSNRHHITLTANGEAIVTKEQSQKLNKILEKYF